MKRAALIALLVASEAHADSITGQQIWDYCRSPEKAQQNACTMYIAGAIDALDHLAVLNPATRIICYPPNIERSTLVSLAIGDLSQSDQMLKWSAMTLIFSSLSHAYPCSTTEGTKP
jgi:hypothetical protein